MPAEIQHGVQCRDQDLGVRSAVLLRGRPCRCPRDACLSWQRVGKQPWREERSHTRIGGSWDRSAEDRAMGKGALVKESWVLGQLPEKWTLQSASTHRWLPAASPGACAEIPLYAEEAAAT